MKPEPQATAESAPFWESCARGALTYQRCRDCRRAQFYPRSLCAQCYGTHLDWEISGGRGHVHSHTIVHRAPNADFAGDTPYVLALVDIAEGFRMMMNVIGCDPTQVFIGMAIQVVFEQRGDMMLPQAQAMGA